TAAVIVGVRDVAAEKSGYAKTNREAKPIAVRSVPRRAHAEEFIEHSPAQLGRNAWAGIADLDTDAIRAVLGPLFSHDAHADCSGVRRVFDRVGQQIGQHL